jgi:hypothetical protein
VAELCRYAKTGVRAGFCLFRFYGLRAGRGEKARGAYTLRPPFLHDFDKDRNILEQIVKSPHCDEPG